MSRLAKISGAVVLLLVSPALAQNVPPTEGIVACRTSPGTVGLTFRISTSPCWSVTEMRAGYPHDASVTATVSTAVSGEDCNMNLVATEVRMSLVAEPAVTDLDLVVLDPDDNPFVMDHTKIVPLGTECPEIPR